MLCINIYYGNWICCNWTWLLHIVVTHVTSQQNHCCAEHQYWIFHCIDRIGIERRQLTAVQCAWLMQLLLLLLPLLLLLLLLLLRLLSPAAAPAATCCPFSNSKTPMHHLSHIEINDTTHLTRYEILSMESPSSAPFRLTWRHQLNTWPANDSQLLKPQAALF